MGEIEEDSVVVTSQGASLTSAAKRRPSTTKKKEEPRPHPALVAADALTDSKKELPVVSARAIIASVVLFAIVYTNMQYAARKDLEELDRPPLDKDYALDKMLQWMEAGGATGALPPRSKIEVRDDLGTCKCIRGVAAVRDIKASEVIAEIPFSQILFDAQSEPLPACTADAQWDVRLATALLREKNRGPASPFFYYIQALPDEITAAVNLDDEDLEKVKYEVGRAKMAAQRPWMETLWMRCLTENPALIAEANWNEFRWAIAVVQSRSFGLLGKLLENQDGGHVERRSNGSGLVPLMDLLNHAESHSALWETAPDGRSVLLKASRDISAGEEVCDSYGKKGNDELLISYGFVTRDNQYDYMALFDDEDAAIEWLFDTFPCKKGHKKGRTQKVVSRAPGCQEDVMRLVRQRLEAEPLPPIVEVMTDEAHAEYYKEDIKRMGLFVNGTEDSRLTAAFESAFSHSCFLCAPEEGGKDTGGSLQDALEQAEQLVEKTSGLAASSPLQSRTVNGMSDLAVKMRVLELLKPFGITFSDDDESQWRKPAQRGSNRGSFREQVIKEYNDNRIKLLLARLDAVNS